MLRCVHSYYLCCCSQPQWRCRRSTARPTGCWSGCVDVLGWGRGACGTPGHGEPSSRSDFIQSECVILKNLKRFWKLESASCKVLS